MRSAGEVERLATGNDLDQERVVERGDDRAGIAHAAVEPQAEAAGER
jgi:hypothetical protein